MADSYANGARVVYKSNEVNRMPHLQYWIDALVIGDYPAGDDGPSDQIVIYKEREWYTGRGRWETYVGDYYEGEPIDVVLVRSLFSWQPAMESDGPPADPLQADRASARRHPSPRGDRALRSPACIPTLPPSPTRSRPPSTGAAPPATL